MRADADASRSHSRRRDDGARIVHEGGIDGARHARVQPCDGGLSNAFHKMTASGPGQREWLVKAPMPSVLVIADRQPYAD